VPTIRPHLRREDSEGKYAPGVTFAIDVIELCGNTGTYIDSPFHRHADGADLAGLPLQRLHDLPGVRVGSTADHGVDPDFLEAMAFAWLARETLEHRAGNLPDVTGARGPRVLGAIYPR
jgi:kynurenine formamidase